MDKMKRDCTDEYLKVESTDKEDVNICDLSVSNCNVDKLTTSIEKNEHAANKHDIGYILNALFKIYDNIIFDHYKPTIWEIIELAKEMVRRKEDDKYFNYYRQHIIDFAKDNIEDEKLRNKYITGIGKYFVATSPH